MENKFDELIMKRDSVVSMGIPVFSDEIPSTSPALQQALFDISTCEADKTSYYSLGFLDAQHNNTTPIRSNTIFDLIIHTPPPAAPSPVASTTSLPESSEVVNTTPPTPNSSSSNEEATAAANYDQQQTSKTVEEEDEEEEEDKTTMKQLKLKKKKKKDERKRQREARFAFMTKSEVDQLDDGYRWRKYGQKAVKNTHFPRSYYRCTTASCGVKKRVERWCEDASIVVTTYEGTHTHPCPMKHAGSGGLAALGNMPPPSTASTSFFPTTTTTAHPQGSSYCFEEDNNNVILIPSPSPSSQQLHYPLQPTTSYFRTPTTYTNNISSGAALLCARATDSITTTTLHTNLLAVPVPVPQLRHSLPPSSLSLSSSSLIRDHGLLQDMVPFQMVKQEEQPGLPTN